MSAQHVHQPRVAGRRGSAPWVGLLVVVLAAGCAGGDLSDPSSPAAATGYPLAPLPVLTPLPSVSPAAPAAATPVPTEIPGPPAAALTPIGGAAVPGELGGFTWRGMGSEAPWLVPAAEQAVHGPGPYAVSLAPPVLIERWTARWAPVVDGAADAVAGAERGTTGAVVLKGPNRPGTWSLQVDLRLASGDRCSYYWRLVVAP